LYLQIHNLSLEGRPGSGTTDLVDGVDPDSQNVEVTDGDAARLVEQLRLLGEQVYHVVCFGNEPSDGLVDYFDAAVTTHSPEIKHATVRTDGRCSRGPDTAPGPVVAVRPGQRAPVSRSPARPLRQDRGSHTLPLRDGLRRPLEMPSVQRDVLSPRHWANRNER